MATRRNFLKAAATAGIALCSCGMLEAHAREPRAAPAHHGQAQAGRAASGSRLDPGACGMGAFGLRALVRRWLERNSTSPGQRFMRSAGSLN